MIEDGKFKVHIKQRNIREINQKKYYYSSKYGDFWVELSTRLRKKYRRCQWCDKKFRNTCRLQGHHIGCVKYNPDQKLDERIIIVVCDGCHTILEPWSKINLTQMLPQLFE